MIPSEWLDEARVRLDGLVRTTPLEWDERLCLYLKWENQQITGSFKIRGAVNKVKSLQIWEQKRGLVAASAGNHGQGVALAAQETGSPVTVFASDHAVPAKIEAMRALGADVRLVAGGYADAEKNAIRYVQENDCVFVSPYNDAQVIAGQGTLGLELQDQTHGKPVDVLLVPAGGGGLATGIGLALERWEHRPKLIAVQSTASAFLHDLFFTGSQNATIEQDSIADGLSGAVQEGSLTIPLVRKLVDDFWLVNEEEIAQAISFAWMRYHQKIEGSAAVALAAGLSGKLAGKTGLVVLTGGNIQAELHEQICRQWSAWARERVL